MKHTETYKIKLPTWAASAMVNGDESGNTASDLVLIENFEKKMTEMAKDEGASLWVLSLGDAEPYFTNNPEFGLASDVIDSAILFFE